MNAAIGFYMDIFMGAAPQSARNWRVINCCIINNNALLLLLHM